MIPETTNYKAIAIYNEFIKASIDDKIGSLIKNAGKTTIRVIKNADLSKIFGV